MFTFFFCFTYRDEEGFLSEWIAYYQMHGFDHIMLFNDSSIDNSHVEIQPWVDSKFVSVVSSWTAESLNANPNLLQTAFGKNMVIKRLLERMCKLKAIELKYDYFVSLDIDEYMVPLLPEDTIVDAMDKWFNYTEGNMYCISKLNFQQTPHTLEPVNLLTIEAYQTRMKSPSRMNYYTTVADKCAFRLQHPAYTTNTTEYIATCCHFHGCGGGDTIKGSRFCKHHDKLEGIQVKQSMAKGKWYEALNINHYSRSVEKYALKAQTWQTSTGEFQGSFKESEKASKNYDIVGFFHRNVGWYSDNIAATRYGCQLRELLRNMTGEPVYLRPGDQWYRNPEFGRYIAYPAKRRRYGRPNPPGFHYKDGNMYHYHGGYTMEELNVLYSKRNASW